MASRLRSTTSIHSLALTDPAAAGGARARIPDFRLAFRALDEEEIDRADLYRLLEILEEWERGQLNVSCAEVLIREFRVDPNLVRRWETELVGQPSTRVGPYHLRRRIGQGGMGVVYEADHPNLDRTVALKILTPGRRDPIDIQRFLREVKSAGQFNHPNIVHAYDAGIDGDIPYLAMEFVDGENLFQVLLREGPIDEARAVRWLAQATSALWFLEAVGWTHGDGKPSNWVIPDSNELKLIDLGLCRPPGKPRDPEMIHGSPPYIAPEQLGTGERIDIRSDLYALGATFYHLLYGDPPYRARTVRELVKAYRTETITPLREVCPHVSRPLAEVIDRLLQRKPADRFQSCAELAVTLGEIPGCPRIPPPDRAAEVRRPKEDEPTSPNPTRRRLLLSIVAGVCLLAGAFGASMWWQESDSNSNADVSDPGDPSVVSGTEDELTSGEPSSPEAIPKENWFELWSAKLSASEPDYPVLLTELETRSRDPRAGEGARDLEKRFSMEARTAWSRMMGSVETLKAQNEWREALDEARAFPDRLRMGEYSNRAAALEQTLETELDRQVQELVVALRAELGRGDVLIAQSRYRRAVNGSSKRAQHYREHLPEDLASLPWLDQIGRHRNEYLDGRAERLASLRESWDAKRPLPARWSPRPEDVTLELVAELIHRYPGVVQDDGTIFERLYRAGLLASMSRQDLQIFVDWVEPISGSNPQERRSRRLVLEKEAADLAARAREACQLWANEPAVHAWDRLAVDRLAETTAAKDLALNGADWRRQLIHGEFLRGPHFSHQIEGGWGEAPTIATRIRKGQIERDWRLKKSAVDFSSAGLVGKSKDSVCFLEPVIPFEGPVALELFLTPPADRSDWTIIVRFDDRWLGLVHRPGGPAFATFGSKDTVDRAREQRTGSILLDADLGNQPQSLRFTFDAGRALFGTSTQDIAVDLGQVTQSGWVLCAIYGSVTIDRIQIKAKPVPAWIEARRELTQ